MSLEGLKSRVRLGPRWRPACGIDPLQGGYELRQINRRLTRIGDVLDGRILAFEPPIDGPMPGVTRAGFTFCDRNRDGKRQGWGQSRQPLVLLIGTGAHLMTSWRRCKLLHEHCHVARRSRRHLSGESHFGRGLDDAGRQSHAPAGRMPRLSRAVEARAQPLPAPRRRPALAGRPHRIASAMRRDIGREV